MTDYYVTNIEPVQPTSDTNTKKHCRDRQRPNNACQMSEVSSIACHIRSLGSSNKHLKRPLRHGKMIMPSLRKMYNFYVIWLVICKTHHYASRKYVCLSCNAYETALCTVAIFRWWLLIIVRSPYGVLAKETEARMNTGDPRPEYSLFVSTFNSWPCHVTIYAAIFVVRLLFVFSNNMSLLSYCVALLGPNPFILF